MFFLKLAWRNIFRNKRRTIIAGIAIGIGLACMIFMDALMEGMQTNLIDSITSTFLGEAQIHDSDYRELKKVELTVNKPQKVLEQLSNDKKIEDYSPRVVSFGMINSPINVRSIILYGVKPELEKNISVLDESIVEGSYLAENKTGGLLIGKELAENLEINLNERVILTLSEVNSGELSQEMLKVKGIFSLAEKEIEKSMVFIHYQKAQNMLGLDNQFHEIAVTFREKGLANTEKNYFTEKYTQYGNEAVNWPTILPSMQMVFNMKNLSLSISGIIIFGVVIFGIFNTLFMSIYERFFEFGVVRAVGTRSSGVMKLIILEAFCLGIVSCLMGIILGFGVTYWVSIIGIDYTGIEFAGATFSNIIYPEMTATQFILYPVLILIFVVIVSIYPALYAGKMKIAEAMRRSF